MNPSQIEIIQQKYKCRIIEQNTDYFFNMGDIGRILELKNINQNILYNKTLILTKSPGGIQKMVYINYND